MSITNLDLSGMRDLPSANTAIRNFLQLFLVLSHIQFNGQCPLFNKLGRICS
jgi:hypothetical protein